MRSKSLFIVFSLVVASLISSSIVSANANTEDNATQVEVNVNGSFVRMDVYPTLYESSLLIPIRTLASLGLSYQWDPSSKSATIENQQGDVLIMKQDSAAAYLNGHEVNMTVPAQNIHGRILVPMRFISESFGYHVQYETIRKIVFITSENYEMDTSTLTQSNVQAARQAAISLPITSDFDTLGFPKRPYDRYRFLKGKADLYLYNDAYTHSIVRIKEGKAVLIAQYVSGARSGFSHTAGHIDDPDVQIFFDYQNKNNLVFFNKEDNNTVTGYYANDTDREPQTFTSPIEVYSDIIQEIPR